MKPILRYTKNYKIESHKINTYLAHIISAFEKQNFIDYNLGEGTLGVPKFTLKLPYLFLE